MFPRHVCAGNGGDIGEQPLDEPPKVLGRDRLHQRLRHERVTDPVAQRGDEVGFGRPPLLHRASRAGHEVADQGPGIGQPQRARGQRQLREEATSDRLGVVARQGRQETSDRRRRPLRRRGQRPERGGMPSAQVLLQPRPRAVGLLPGGQTLAGSRTDGDGHRIAPRELGVVPRLVMSAGAPVPLLAQQRHPAPGLSEGRGIPLQCGHDGSQGAGELAAAGGDDGGLGAGGLEGGAAPGARQPPPLATLAGDDGLVDRRGNERQLACDPVDLADLASGPRQSAVAGAHPITRRPMTANRSSTSP